MSESRSSRTPLQRAMFKSILPTRRVPSSDFSMVTSLQETKENYPSLGVAPQPAGRNPKSTFRKASSQLYDRKKRTEPKAGKGQDSSSSVEPAQMNQAFDQLLVRPDLSVGHGGLPFTSSGRSSNSFKPQAQADGHGFHCQGCHAQIIHYPRETTTRNSLRSSDDSKRYNEACTFYGLLGLSITEYFH